MAQRISPFAFALVALPALAGCGAATYTPRPSPRITMMTEGGSLVLVKNGRSYAFGAFGGQLEEAVQGNPQAEAEAHAYKNKTITGFVLNMIGSVAGGVGAGVLVANQLSDTPSNGLLAGSIALVIGGLVLSITGNAISSSAQPHIWNAINIYNDGLPAYPAYPSYPGYPGYPSAPGYPAAPGYGPRAYPPSPATPAPYPNAYPFPSAPAPAAPTAPPAAPATPPH